MEWIIYKYNRSKGFEIGTTNPSLMLSLFAEQSRAWGFHALNHVTKVIRKIHYFNYKVLQYCCNDDALCERLWDKLLQPLLPSSLVTNCPDLLLWILLLGRSGITPLGGPHKPWFLSLLAGMELTFRVKIPTALSGLEYFQLPEQLSKKGSMVVATGQKD
jgi:hypothetical protein